MKRRRHKKIAPEAYKFDGVRLRDAHGACVWEYAQLSRALRNAIEIKSDAIPLRAPVKFLAAIRGILGPELFLRVPWVVIFEKLCADMPELQVEPIVVQNADYPAKLIQGAEVHQDANHIVVSLDLTFTKGEVLEAIGRMYDYYQPRGPASSLGGRAQDWMARLTWLGWYRLRRAGYSYREIAALCCSSGETETMVRQIKRGVSKVPEIFHALFPFLRLRRPKRSWRSYL